MQKCIISCRGGKCEIPVQKNLDQTLTAEDTEYGLNNVKAQACRKNSMGVFQEEQRSPGEEDG